jgi:hypothetical protein
MHDDRQQLRILTDSQTSIYAILNELHRPMTTAKHLHRDLLRAIADMLVHRDKAGKRTEIRKVRAHIGVWGNEVADAAAKLQAHGGEWDKLSRDEQWMLNHAGRPYTSDVWQVAVGCDPPADGFLRLKIPGGDPATADWEYTAGDPRLQAHVAKQCHTYGSNTGAAHFTMMLKMNAPELGRHGTISDRYMRTDKFTHGHRRTVKQLLYGTFQTQKRDHLMRPESFPSGHCILCADRHSDGPQIDGCGHVMGGCQHPHMHARYITRHNEAVALIAQAIAMGDYGRWLVVADLNKDDRDSLSAQVRQTVRPRLPGWLLPNVAKETRDKLRPDLLFVIGAEEGNVPDTPPRVPGKRQRQGTAPQPAEPDPGRKRAIIIEVGYTQDSEMAERLETKMAQHLELAAALTGAGWETEIVPIVLGHCGSVLKSGMDAVRALGVSKEATGRLFNDLHDNAITHTCAAAWTHRALRQEANLAAGRRWQRRPKKARG